MKRRKFTSLILVSLPILLLSGCWDLNEPERMVYIQGIGIDYKDQKYTVYAQIVNTSSTAKTEAISGGTDAGVVVGHGSGKSINEALFDLYASSQRRLFWGHLSFIIFTEKALKHTGLQRAIDQFDRYRETRYSIQFYATKTPLIQLLTSLPPMETSTYFSRLSDPKAANEQRSLVNPVNLRELLIALNEPPYEAVIPYIGVTKKAWKSELGQTPAIQFEGIALLSRKGLMKMIPLKKVQGVTWMNENFKRETLALPGDLSDVSLVFTKMKAKKKTAVRGNSLTFQITIESTATLAEITNHDKQSKIITEAENVIRSDIKKTFREGLKHNMDIYRLSEVAYRDKVKAWRKMERNGKIPLSEDSLQNVTVKIKLIHGEKQKMEPTL